MAVTAPRRSPAQDNYDPVAKWTHQRLDAVTLLTVYIAALILIPSRLVFRPIGAAGTVANVLALGLMFMWAASRLAPTLAIARGLQPLRAAVGLFLLAVLVSYVTGMLIGYPSPVGIRSNLGATVPLPVDHVDFVSKIVSGADRGLITAAAWAGVALFAADGILRMSRLEQLLSRLTLFGAAMATIGIWQFYSDANLSDYIKIPGLSANVDFGTVESRSIFSRVVSTAIHPIEFSVVLAAIVPIALHYALYARRGTRLLRWLVVVLLVAAVPMAIARSGVLVLGVALVVMYFGWPRRWRMWTLILLPIYVVGLRLAVPGLVGTIRSLFTNLFSDPSTTGRTGRYSMAMDVIHQSPIFGRGLATFIAGFYTPMDNQALLTTIEMGLVGLVALLSLLATGFLLAKRARRWTTDDRTSNLALSLAASIAGLAVSYVTFDALAFPMAASLTFLLLGSAGALWRLARSEAASARTLVFDLERIGSTSSFGHRATGHPNSSPISGKAGSNP